MSKPGPNSEPADSKPVPCLYRPSAAAAAAPAVWAAGAVGGGRALEQTSHRKAAFYNVILGRKHQLDALAGRQS